MIHTLSTFVLMYTIWTHGSCGYHLFHCKASRYKTRAFFDARMKSFRATEHSIPLRAAGADDASAINYLRFQESGHTWIYNLQKYIRHEEVKKQNRWHN
jgi:hypothetical protein